MTRDGICLTILGFLWVLVGSYPLILRATQCPGQPLHQPCTITIKQ